MSKFVIQISKDTETRRNIVMVNTSKSTLLPMVKLYKDSEKYNRGLEKNHTSLVDLQTMAGNISSTLTMYIAMDNLTEETYEAIINCYKPVIYRYRAWKDIQAFMEEREEETWL